MHDYDGLGIWIDKKYLEPDCEKSISKVIKKSLPLDPEDFLFNGKLLLLSCEPWNDTKKFQKFLSKMCVNKEMYCHCISIELNKKKVFILEFSKKFNTKNINIFKNFTSRPQWYYLTKNEYKTIIASIQYGTYEDVYLDSLKDYVDSVFKDAKHDKSDEVNQTAEKVLKLEKVMQTYQLQMRNAQQSIEIYGNKCFQNDAYIQQQDARILQQDARIQTLESALYQQQVNIEKYMILVQKFITANSKGSEG